MGGHLLELPWRLGQAIRCASLADLYFGKRPRQGTGILTVGFDKYGDEAKLKDDAITHLYNVYVAINKDAEAEVLSLVKEARAKEGRADDPAEPTKAEIDAANAQAPIHSAARAFFRKMEDGDEASLATWRKFRDLSIVKYREVYARLNIEFDVYGGESQVGQAMLVCSALASPVCSPEHRTGKGTRAARGWIAIERGQGRIDHRLGEVEARQDGRQEEGAPRLACLSFRLSDV